MAIINRAVIILYFFEVLNCCVKKYEEYNARYS